MEDVAENLDIGISHFILDAGYAGKQLIQTFQSGNEQGNIVTLRMPAKKGYPYKTLYHQSKKLMSNAKYEFIRQGHTYFGKHCQVEIFGASLHAYVYGDKDTALEGSRTSRLNHEDDYQKLTDKEKNWTAVRFGYFVLLSSEEKKPD